MQTRPSNWSALFAAPHKTEYRFVIDGVTFDGGSVQGTPTITKPLLDKPALGRVCTGSVSVTLHPGNTEIPKAATVNPYCRLCSADGNTVTDWIPLGKYFISTRSGTDPLTLSCLDGMIKAGTTYRDKTAIEEWPAPMQDVLDEISEIMGMPIDTRTVINTGTDYVVPYPNDDTLISEILGMIGAAHGANWIATESGALRMIVFASPLEQAHQVLGKSHGGFQARGKRRTVTKVILTDSAKNEFESGDDTGMALSVMCECATQSIAANLCTPAGSSVANGCVDIVNATIARGQIAFGYGSLSNGLLILPSDSVLYGVTYDPYTLSGAYLDPCVELGDTLSVTDRAGTVHRVIVQSIKMNCTVACTSALSASIDGETEDEYPYMTMQELTISRTIRSDQTYYGNRLTRTEGFVSDLLVNGEATARLTANASVFSMQTRVDGQWVDRIYFDNATGKYVISADVTMTGVVTLNALSEEGQSVINGANITTGSLSANKITAGVLKSSNNELIFNLDDGTFTVGDKDLADTLSTIDNNITLLASSQFFSKATGETTYTPSTITLTASSAGNIVSYQWYKNDVLISGAAARTLSVVPTDITGNTATYKVIGSDSLGNQYTDILSIAKLSDGQPGTAGTNGYTVLLSNEYIEVPVNVARKATAANSYTSTVSVFDGLTPLTPTLGTPTAGQFKITVNNAVAGITVSQSTAGTLTLTTNTTTALADSATILLTITAYGGASITAAIVIQANMNSVVVTHQSAIDVMDAAISLRVTETAYHMTVPTYSTTDPSTGWTDAQKAANTGYLWYDVTGDALKKWSGSEWVTTTAENADTWATAAQSSIDLNAQNITLKVSKASVISEINQSAEAITISASKVNLSGYVTITGLSGGTTTINGGCITTGTINASLVTITNLNASNIKSGTLSASYISGGTLNFNHITATNINGSSITSGTINAANVTITNLNASNIKSGTLDASQVTVSNINASNIKSGSLSASYISGGTLNFNNITATNISGTSITSGTINASNVTITNLNASNIKSGSLSASYISGGTLNFSNITATNISGDSITSGTIDASKVTVTNINASNITSGKISADRIDTTNMYVQNIYALNSSSYRIAIKTSSWNDLYIGGDGTWNVSYLYLYANYSVYLGSYNNSLYRLIFDVSGRTIRGGSTGSSYGWDLGTSSYPFYNLYASNCYLGISNGTVQIGAANCAVHIGNSTTARVGFFETTPVAKKSQATCSSSTTSALMSTLNTLISNLKGYGLFS